MTNRTVAILFLTSILSSANPLYSAQSQSEKPAAQTENMQAVRSSVITIVTRIQRADYEGDRPALETLFQDLAPFAENHDLASRVRYWRGFAKWRRAINGFNETVDLKIQEDDLNAARGEFDQASALDPTFMDGKIGAASCFGILIGLHLKEPDRVHELAVQARALIKEVQAAQPDNPRLAFVYGPNVWYAPPERGGGQDKAIEVYQKGLDAARKQKPPADPLEPSWGEPELLMNLAWSNLNRTTPDLKVAQQDAEAALKIVPYWHYVRDILLPQISAAQAKAAAH
jgi:hypothetical protein